jgi:hypothetical protein
VSNKGKYALEMKYSIATAKAAFKKIKYIQNNFGLNFFVKQNQ